ncbi:MAG TPA: glutathione S-transferase family protein [Caulobacteraceae bacterium]|jgi:glutathione S-transferase|nr:glutathione S-transferase family protein [Caulobacteraceae bacterium]
MLELHHAHISTCSQKVRLCLAEKELEWVGRPINFALREHLTAQYLAINPNGVVPTLVHDGAPVIDSSVICEYLDETAPARGAALMPTDALGRARVRAWLRYIEEVPTAAIRIPSFNRLFLAGWKTLGAAQREAYVAATPLRKAHYRSFGDSGFSDAAMDESLARLRQTLERIEAATAKGPWLAGEAFGLADICVTPTLVRMEDLDLAHLWTDLPGAADWFARVQARPSFAAAYYPGSRVSPAAFDLAAS